MFPVRQGFVPGSGAE